MSSPLVFLDFDGVLFDTVGEAWRVCLGSVETGLRSAIEEGEGKERFFRFRHLITSAWTYFPLILAIRDAAPGTASRVVELFHEGCVKHRTDADEFERRFFSERSRLRAADERTWLSWHRPYPFLEGIGRLAAFHPGAFHVVTTKDEQTVEVLLNRHGSDILRSGGLWGVQAVKRHGGKRAVIERALALAGVPRGIFVDDSRAHLDECRAVPGLECVQPDWGYAAPGDGVLPAARVLQAAAALLGGA